MESFPGWLDIQPRPPRVLAVRVPDRFTSALANAAASAGARLLVRSPVSPEQLDRLLDGHSPTVVVIGAYFRDEPVELLQRLCAPPHRAFLPFVALVDKPEQRRAVIAAGFDAALDANAEPDDLAAVLAGLLGRQDRITRTLGVDTATGLLAPEAFLARVDEAISVARRYSTQGSLGIVHVGRDVWAHGEDEGSHLEVTPLTLRWAAALTRAALRDVDVLGVTGDRSIGIVFGGTAIGGAIVAMRRVLDFLAEATDPTTNANPMMSVTGAVASFGNDGVEDLMSRFVRALTARRDRSPGTLIIV